MRDSALLKRTYDFQCAADQIIFNFSPTGRGGGGALGGDASSRPFGHSMKTNLLEAAAPIEGYHTTEDTLGAPEIRDPMRDPPRGIFDDI